MEKTILIFTAILICAVSAGAVQFEKNAPTSKPEALLEGDLHETFRQNIPSIAQQFIGIPYKLGGDPRKTGTSDNSYLFFSVYSLAAQQAGMVYHGYLPMKNLLQRFSPVDERDLKNGDLMVLDNNLAALIYQVDASGRIHLIYASHKRQQVISFNSDNIVFQVYWLENLKGFYRLNDAMIRPAR